VGILYKLIRLNVRDPNVARSIGAFAPRLAEADQPANQLSVRIGVNVNVVGCNIREVEKTLVFHLRHAERHCCSAARLYE
jgi:hypothetical protein